MQLLLRFILLLLIITQGFACGNSRKIDAPVRELIGKGDSVSTRFETPPGFIRIKSDKYSFREYLQTLKLKPEGTVAKNFDGSIKEPRDVYEAVFDIDAGSKDLQQCADAIMRLRAEYLYAQQRYKEIAFNFTNGFRAEYSKWRNGYRIIVKGNKATWNKKFGSSESYEEFRSYLEIVFTYAGTLSLSKELKPVEIPDIQIGDIFIKGGSPGHAVIIVDMAVNENTGEKLFVLAQSYMPAQDIQILKNQNEKNLSPWYSDKFDGDLFTPEWTFKKSELKRF
jgi:hypothetical protein